MKNSIFPKKATNAAIAVLASAMISGCGVGEASVAGSDALAAAIPVPVETSTPLRSDIYATYIATASISSDADAPVTARVAGGVVELLVEEGDKVAAGDILARLDGERLRLEMLAAKANLERAEREYVRNTDLHQRGLVSTAMFEGLRYDLESLKATYDLKRLNYDYSNIRATISGIVSSRDIKPGQNLVAGQVAFRITETSELVAYLQIPQAELSKFATGQTATIEVAAMPGEVFDATIARVSPTIDARNGTFRATAIIDNKAGNLAPGMFGRFTIAYEKHADALTIPANALLDEDDAQTVYVVNEGQAVRRVVKTGIKNSGRIEILGGLEDSDEVVIVGHSSLRDGSKVLASAANPGRYAG
jgi:membrane fusion protein (multidrug efflux system)